MKNENQPESDENQKGGLWISDSCSDEEFEELVALFKLLIEIEKRKRPHESEGG